MTDLKLDRLPRATLAARQQILWQLEEQIREAQHTQGFAAPATLAGILEDQSAVRQAIARHDARRAAEAEAEARTLAADIAAVPSAMHAERIRRARAGVDLVELARTTLNPPGRRDAQKRA